jgi:hypothetical protein
MNRFGFVIMIRRAMLLVSVPIEALHSAASKAKIIFVVLSF